MAEFRWMDRPGTAPASVVHLQPFFQHADPSMNHQPMILIAGSQGLPEQTQSFLGQQRVDWVCCRALTEFENQIRNGIGVCVITDWEFQGVSALDLQDVLDSDTLWVPLIVSAPVERPSMLVEVMRRGAMAVVEPGADEQLSEYIWDALQCYQSHSARHQRIRETRACLALLTPEELAVMDMICAGHPNKVVAIQLEMGLRTVETRRQRVFRKLQVETLAQLIQRVVEADIAVREREFRSRRIADSLPLAMHMPSDRHPRAAIDRHDATHAVSGPQVIAGGATVSPLR